MHGSTSTFVSPIAIARVLVARESSSFCPVSNQLLNDPSVFPFAAILQSSAIFSVIKRAGG